MLYRVLVNRVGDVNRELRVEAFDFGMVAIVTDTTIPKFKWEMKIPKTKCQRQNFKYTENYNTQEKLFNKIKAYYYV